MLRRKVIDGHVPGPPERRFLINQGGRSMLTETDVQLLTEKVYRLLEDVGILVENDKLKEIALMKGCKSGPDDRIRIPKRLIEEMVAFQKKTQAEDDRDQELYPYCGVDWTHHIVWNKKQDEIRTRLKKEFLMPAFDVGPTTYYDYQGNRVKPIDTEIFDISMKFAEATPEIGFINTWYRQDVPAQIERLDSLNRGMRLTTKLNGLDEIYPENVKYLKEASEIITGRAGDSSYLAGGACLTPPLILGKRSADDISERARLGVHRYHVCSMLAIGINTPATVAGAIVMSAAEVLGGMAVCWCADPESDLSGRMICLATDMRTAQINFYAPEVLLTNLGVKQLFDLNWGGHCWVEVTYGPYARKPGLQTVFENFLGMYNYANWVGKPEIPYPGMGSLYNGGTGSPTQFMLDMEIRKAQWWNRQIKVDEETINFDEICQRIRDRSDFLTSDHTMAHFRELWTSKLSLTDDPFSGGAWDGTEKAILDKCEEMWRANLEKWEPPEWPEDKLKAMDALLVRAKKEYGID